MLDMWFLLLGNKTYPQPVSYTHLDVYKRQAFMLFVEDLAVGKLLGEIERVFQGFKK